MCERPSSTERTAPGLATGFPPPGQNPMWIAVRRFPFASLSATYEETSNSRASSAEIGASFHQIVTLLSLS